MKVTVKVKRTFVFNERGNQNPKAYIYVNCTDLFDAYKKAAKYAVNEVVLVDCYPLTSKVKLYDSVPSWAI